MLVRRKSPQWLHIAHLPRELAGGSFLRCRIVGRSYFWKWAGCVLADVSGADAASGQELAAVVFMSGWAVVRRSDLLAGFGGSLDECLPDAQNGWLSVGACG